MWLSLIFLLLSTVVWLMFETPTMILGEMIQAWREKNKISRRKLALQVGIDHTTLARLENNDVQSISMDTVTKILLWICGAQ